MTALLYQAALPVLLLDFGVYVERRDSELVGKPGDGSSDNLLMSIQIRDS